MDIFIVFEALASITTVAADPSPMDVITGQSMGTLQSMVFEFVAWVVGGAAAGAILGRLIGGKQKAVREAIFSISCLAGMSLGVLHHYDKLFW